MNETWKIENSALDSLNKYPIIKKKSFKNAHSMLAANKKNSEFDSSLLKRFENNKQG